jgi:hypothetical protein
MLVSLQVAPARLQHCSFDPEREHCALRGWPIPRDFRSVGRAAFAPFLIFRAADLSRFSEGSEGFGFGLFSLRLQLTVSPRLLHCPFFQFNSVASRGGGGNLALKRTPFADLILGI